IKYLYELSSPAPALSIVFCQLNRLEDSVMPIPYLGIPTKTLFKLSHSSELVLIAFADSTTVLIQWSSLSLQAFT
ncbi:hypothetical protein ACLPHZ_02235, partial [Alcaligenaceae bacterium Me47]